MPDFSVTDAAAWSEEQYNEVIEYLEGAGMTEMARQAKENRERGQAGLDEWARIEEVAATMSADELAQVGKGPHLLEGREAETSSSSPTPRPSTEAKATKEDSE